MKYLLALLCSLEILDGIFTRWAVTKGLVREWNPLVAHIAGDWHFLLLKSAGALLCVLALWSIHRYFPRVAFAGAGCVVAFYGTVLAWNSLTLLLA